ncbi:D-inositol-3-phosphate glycosyltransferase protein [Dioscorea alata]|uniref:D-inositol-3-phosphate glycosyltransferase protein n=1 Tax=Dioscorea alata TaxID=55571 RepID=A0ACB7VUV5_DIOAL|nr:D-inositol-3-phosphate glycosyltransferase protein [Dioscorea alata]
MAKDPTSTSSITFQHLCYLLFAISALSSISFIYWSHCSTLCSCATDDSSTATSLFHRNQSLNLLTFPSALNHISFSSNPPPKLLKIALFVKRWPQRNLAGGLERHALTLHLALARRGHQVHIFTTTTSSSTNPNYPNVTTMRFHFTPPSPGGYLNQALAWQQFQTQNSSDKPFDVIHTESVGLFHGRARNISHLAVSWHGIAYETIHSDIVQDLLRGPNETRQSVLAERLAKVIEEVKFFNRYSHHVATSDHVGDVLKRIYMIPEERVHIIVNGVDETIYKPDSTRGKDFRREAGVPDNATLVIGMAGRLVKDKGHPLMFEALKQLSMEDENFKRDVFVLVAGDGPWGSRYRDLGPNLLVLGPLEQTQLAKFYNSLDVFINPTLRAQGLDHTFIEAMLSGISVMGTRFASITGSLIVDSDIGYTFLPTVDSLKKSLRMIFRDGREVLSKRGMVARNRAVQLFTATKMATAYERLFLCISKSTDRKNDKYDYCKYPLPWD